MVLLGAPPYLCEDIQQNPYYNQMQPVKKTPIGAQWEHWDHGTMEVFWWESMVNVCIGHPDYKFKFKPKRALEFITAIRSAIEQQAHGIVYDNSEPKPGLRIRVDSPHTNDSKEDELFHNEYHLQIKNKRGGSHGFWLDKDCLLRLADEIEHLLNNDTVRTVMTT
jgi:hypothetical protein